MIAIEHLSGVDPRTALILQRKNVLRDDIEPEVEDPGRSLLLRGTRVASPPGPLVFLREPESGGVGVINLAERVLDPDPEIRTRALDHLESISSPEEELLCASTVELLRASRSSILSSLAEAWRPAALRAHDAVGEDWLCSLALLRQSIATRYEEGYRSHILRVLRPSVASLSAVPIPPRLSDPEITSSLVGEITKEKELLSLLDSYYARLGFVPLGGEGSLAGVVTSWMFSNEEASCDWDLLWEWADSLGSPTPRYHVCQLLIGKPGLIPEDKKAELWSQITQVILGASDEESEVGLREAWLLRCDLARHFTQYILEVGAGGDGELCALLGWWLAEKVGVLPGTDAGEVKRFRESTVREELALSSIVRELVHPDASPSSLLYETLFATSIWSRSLESSLCKASSELVKFFAGSAGREQVTTALVRSLIMGSEADASGYGFDQPLVPAVEQWMSEMGPDDEAHKVLSACLAAQKELSALSAERALAQLAKGNEADDLLLAGHVRRSVYSRTLDAGELWAKFDEAAWREKVFVKLSANALVVLLDAFCQLQVFEENWRTGFPHLCALAAEENSGDAERSPLLFGMTVCASTSSGTVSALRRLLTGKEAAAFVGDARHWHSQLAAVASAFPGAVAAQIRPIVGELVYAK